MLNTKKKILIIVPTLRRCGQERVALRTFEILKDKYDVYLLIFNSVKEEYELLNNKININIPASRGKLFKIINVIKRTKRVKDAKKKYNIEISMSFGDSANLINILSKVNEKTILSIRNYTFVNKLLGKHLYEKSDITTCVTKLIKESTMKRYDLESQKLQTVYNPYDLKEITMFSEKAVTDYEFYGKTIVLHARFNKQKRHDVLIRAFRLVCDVMDDVQLLLLGDGEEKENICMLVDILNLNDRVHLLGNKINPFKYIKRSDVFVLSSEREGFPNSLVEAMCCGIPVISTNCKSGPNEILSNNIRTDIADISYEDYGVLVPIPFNELNYLKEYSDCEYSLAKAIVELLKNEKLYSKYKLKAIERASEYSYESYTDTIETIFKKLYSGCE